MAIRATGSSSKQGCFDNWIVDNLVHDTFYPCILAYGTYGQPVNHIERNVVFNCVDNVMQVQGEAIVRNNLIMNGKHGFHSHDHQDQTRDLVFEHNTIINDGTAAYLASWFNRPGMVFANNVVYSGSKEAAIFNGGGAGGVVRAGNVRFGPVYGANQNLGFTLGNGISDFEGASWDATLRNALPSATSAFLAAADTAHAAGDDLTRSKRGGAIEAGAFEYGSWGQHYGPDLAGSGGLAPRASVGSAVRVGEAFTLELTKALPAPARGSDDRCCAGADSRRRWLLVEQCGLCALQVHERSGQGAALLLGAGVAVSRRSVVLRPVGRDGCRRHRRLVANGRPLASDRRVTADPLC